MVFGVVLFMVCLGFVSGEPVNNVLNFSLR